jgi:hypothetical protein
VIGMILRYSTYLHEVNLIYITGRFHFHPSSSTARSSSFCITYFKTQLISKLNRYYKL